MPQFLSDSTRHAIARLAEVDDAPNLTDPLERLRRIRSVLEALEGDSATLQAVRDALANGESWATLAEAAALKPPAAKWRWQGTDEEIAARHEAGRKRSVRPSSVPTGLPGYSVTDAARKLGVSAQAIYLQVRRGKLRSETLELADGRKYKRVFPDE